MPSILLALGSNLGDRAGHLRTAVSGLASFARVLRLSPVYETVPMYVTDQPAFLNMAVEVDSHRSPPDLLRCLKAVETAGGRQRGERFGPRPIDLDILFYDDLVLARPELEIPHPRLAERAFVLCPLADLQPERRHPISGHTIAELRDRVQGRDSVRRLGALDTLGLGQ